MPQQEKRREECYRLLVQLPKQRFRDWAKQVFDAYDDPGEVDWNPETSDVDDILDELLEEVWDPASDPWDGYIEKARVLLEQYKSNPR